MLESALYHECQRSVIRYEPALIIHPNAHLSYVTLYPVSLHPGRKRLQSIYPRVQRHSVLSFLIPRKIYHNRRGKR